MFKWKHTVALWFETLTLKLRESKLWELTVPFSMLAHAEVQARRLHLRMSDHGAQKAGCGEDWEHASNAWSDIVHYEYMALANKYVCFSWSYVVICSTTAFLCFKICPQRNMFVNNYKVVPGRVCIHLLKPCWTRKHSLSGYLFVTH